MVSAYAHKTNADHEYRINQTMFYATRYQNAYHFHSFLGGKFWEGFWWAGEIWGSLHSSCIEHFWESFEAILGGFVELLGRLLEGERFFLAATRQPDFFFRKPPETF